MISSKHFDIGDQERVDVEVVQSQDGHRVLHLEAHHESLQKVLCLLNRSLIFGLSRGFELHASILGVVPDLQLQVLDNGGEDLLPLIPQRSEPVWRAPNSSILGGIPLMMVVVVSYKVSASAGSQALTNSADTAGKFGAPAASAPSWTAFSASTMAFSSLSSSIIIADMAAVFGWLQVESLVSY